jgi:hypothetical protein
MDENMPSDEDLPNYKDDEISKDYVPGNEDDDDFEKVYVKTFDLALRKFITAVEGKEPTLVRDPQVSYEGGQLIYTHTKDALGVGVGNKVTYTIRVYNEGETNGYAEEIADDIPDYLKFLPEEQTNQDYKWVMLDSEGNVTEDSSKAVRITTDYLSKENEANSGDNLIKAFDPTAELSETNPDYKDVQVVFEVVDPGEDDYIITNHAQISKDANENGAPGNDIDSTPGTWNEGEDDQDIENVKVEYFDLALLKYVSQVIVTENGETTVSETGNTGADTDIIPKVEINRKRLDTTTVKFVYTIKITNEGNVEGYAKEITDYIPDGLSFVADDNPQWKDAGNGKITTDALANVLLKPGQSADVAVTFTWINNEDNLGLKNNIAEISEDYNEKNIPDRDSTPGNKVDGEDDIDDAQVLLSISTGTIKTYVLLGGVVLVIVASGVAVIRKYVL